MNITKNLKKKFLSKETIISMLFIVIIFTLDRVSKIKIVNHQLDNNRIFIKDYLNFHLIWNTGISFGLLSQNENIYYHFISFIIFLVIIFLIYLICKANFIEKSLFSIILGGAIGNFYDRLVYLAVPDFIDIHINDFHWFTFNIADIFITIGVICLISKDLILNKK